MKWEDRLAEVGRQTGGTEMRCAYICEDPIWAPVQSTMLHLPVQPRLTSTETPSDITLHIGPALTPEMVAVRTKQKSPLAISH